VDCETSDQALSSHAVQVSDGFTEKEPGRHAEHTVADSGENCPERQEVHVVFRAWTAE
jgi:hypothetical protein